MFGIFLFVTYYMQQSLHYSPVVSGAALSTYPRRHVIVVKHAGVRQTFSVHEVAHHHVEWVAGQGHYDLSYTDALRRMAEKASERG